MLFDENQYQQNKLISLLASDSDYAFQLLYDKYRDKIYDTAMKYLKSPILAQEVVQDVFLKLWFERRNIKNDHPIEAWLFTVAKNNILNRIKKVANEWQALSKLAAMQDKAGYQTDNKVTEAEYYKILRSAIAALPEQQKKVFQLAREDQLTYMQIGEKLGLSPLTVKTHMSRAIGNIKKQFELQGIVLSSTAMIIIINFF